VALGGICAGFLHLMHLRIADLNIAVRTQDPALRLAVSGSSTRFLVDDGQADVTVVTRLGDPRRESRGELLFEAPPLWRLHRDGERLAFSFSSPALGPLPYKEARFAPDFSHGEVVLRHELYSGVDAIDPLGYPLDELLVQGLLAGGRGAELHGCGVISGGRGLLFVGQSGAGKTTMARLWQAAGGVTIASDDRIVVRRDGAGFALHGTPWHGEAALAEPASAPLAGLFFLAKAPENAATPVPPGQAAARLFACGFPPFWDREGVDFTLRFFGELAAAVPCRELAFVPDASVVPFVTRQVEG
jgi:hypothetical protein